MFADREAELFLASLERPAEVQEQTLLETIVGPNTGSELGRRHGFAKIRTVAEYQAAVPITDYEGLRGSIDRIVAGEAGVLTTEPVRRFFLTSGSTSKPKYVPVTNPFARAKSRAFGIYWTLALRQHPGVERAAVVTNFSDSGKSTALPSSGLPVSSESAYWSQVTAATQRRDRPIIPRAVAQIAGAEDRYYTIARVLLEERFSGLMTLNPSTILLLFQRLQEHAPALIQDLERGGLGEGVSVSDEVRREIAERYPSNPRRAAELRALQDKGALLASEVWPGLSLVVSWRSPMLAPYLELLEPHLRGVGVRDYISMASEGVMSIPIEPGRSGGPLAIGTHFYELVPEEEIERPNPTAILPHQAELGRRYVVVLSTQAGLYRYNIGDVVQVSRFAGATPVIEFLHRTGNTCSLTGEKLTEAQVTAAVSRVAPPHPLVSFTAFPAPSGFPRYVLLLELSQRAEPADLERIRATFDRELGALNLEYAGKRSSARLGAPELWLAQPGEYHAHRQRKIAAGANDGQYKPTHLTRDARFGEAFAILERVVAP
jgi:hypothetical protein